MRFHILCFSTGGVIICSDSNHIKTFHEMSNSYEKDHKTTLFYDSQKKEVSVFD